MCICVRYKYQHLEVKQLKVLMSRHKLVSHKPTFPLLRSCFNHVYTFISKLVIQFNRNLSRTLCVAPRIFCLKMTDKKGDGEWDKKTKLTFVIAAIAGRRSRRRHQDPRLHHQRQNRISGKNFFGINVLPACCD